MEDDDDFLIEIGEIERKNTRSKQTPPKKAKRRLCFDDEDGNF